MCNACNDGQKVLGHGVYCKGCSASFFVDLDKREFKLTIDVKHLTYSHISLLDKYATDQNSKFELIPKTDTPTCSFPAHLSMDPLNSSSDSGNTISEVNPLIRKNGDEAIDILQEQLERSTKHGEVTRSRVFSEIFSAPTSDITTGLDRIAEATLSGVSFTSRTFERYENGKDERLHQVDTSQQDLQSTRLIAGDDFYKVENGVTTSSSLMLSTLKSDPRIWKPPEAANIEDDMDSVANNDDDDDDDYGDGTKWGQSTSLGDFDKIQGSSYKEARQKAMLAAMNGQFKILVSRFLASEGLASVDEGHDLGWLDIVTSLSWEAALCVKPDAKEGIAMDPGSYVKVKCVATGARSQSQVIKGLIFKKNAAHKHMPTKCKNPRLLLVKGVLGQRELGLSSFDSMDQEKDYLKSINEMIEACHPNLVLVEKSVSRDIQEFLLAKGMTLVFDMKIARLERIARCTGSQIIPSANILTNRNVTQCDSFHIEKLTEEHNTSNEVGRRTTKTLMFLEGFSKPLGCTILLKGAHIDELKRVKRVVQYTIFAAYQLILETSFFADQSALFSNIDSSEDSHALTHKAVPTIAARSSNFTDTPASNGFLNNSSHEGFYTAHLDANRSSDDSEVAGDFDVCEDNFTQEHLPRSLSNENAVNQSSSLLSSDLSVQLMSSFSASLTKLLSQENRLRPVTSESISSYRGFKEDEHDYPSLSGLPIYSSGTIDDGIEVNDNMMAEKPNYERSETMSILNEPVQYSTAVTANRSETEGKDDSDGVMSSESILVLLSSQCIEKGIVCEQSHLSRIKYYGNFDVSLGRYLQDVLLNQKHVCSSCGEPPEAHIYCYTHQNGNLTVLVRQLPSSSSLSGETEGKIWMWSRCLKCEHENGIPRSSKRVVMSTAARSLSFGKFLELSFTSHSAASRLSSECGHSLHRDCLRFFGLGSKVAMFRYSPIEIYAACKPSPVLEFPIPSEQDWVVQEAKSVLQRGEQFFSEVANVLYNLKMSCPCSVSEQNKNFSGFVKGICEAEAILIQEKAEFDALFKAINCSGQQEKSVNEIIGLSWFNQELLLRLYIWDLRLHHFSQISKDLIRSHDENEKYMGKGSIEIGHIVSGEPNPIPINVQRSFSDSSYNDQNHCYPQPDAVYNSAESFQSSGFDWMECSMEAASFDPSAVENAPTAVYQNPLSSSPDNTSLKEYEEECAALVDPMHEVHNMEPSGYSDTYDLEMMNDNSASGIGLFFGSVMKVQLSSPKESAISDFEDPESLIWVPFPELRIAFKKDLDGGYLHRFLFIHTYTPKYLSPMRQLFPQEQGLLHYPVGTNRKIMAVREDEISSIIACALALSEEQICLLETMDAKNSFEGKMEADKESDNPSNLVSEGSVTSSHWSSNGSIDPVGMHLSHSFSSLSSDEFFSLTLESALSMDRLITSENLHPEVPLGIGKEGLKKYSVVCIHAKQFYALRRMCCPSEQAYVSSLGRCRKWDAQGGKSKAFFAKSMDDRLIIKQIKRAELDSFLKFSSNYFKHINHSLSTGNQTCLAKILGIYQVRLTKNGKEMKIDLMVMENLLFGHNVTRTYDLKGAVFSRYISDVNDPEKVLLDQNFVEDMRLSPIYVGGKTKHLLQRAIWNDTSFLNAINVMDYSLLVGVDKKRQRLVFGIIDYLRQYTWDKQLETWVKASLVVPKNSLPTIISPKEYKKRFRKFMSRYFLTVPNSWCSTECSEPCKFCTGRSDNQSSSHGSAPSQRDV
ncbi:putative 1-phosphatidylinositol-3-phosphate 5-kinase FAB1D isoform X2 [Phalaenopsis equestris]|uniref:putative 1-phosphatidylinositol-3-phosphate 5-kinase FAB1D isoform X2 n=1 Tax=Phalaenopsis equestris TaxID=78828 RepID=UPI0009E35F00|nr:putative 1-phosphatidylinositol-3-phosphate 5-kinase FAB1D isoform X2 [Phalaenopsis equestris]